MNERPFDDIDTIIKQAADLYEPAYDPNAWEQMNARLNEEGRKKRKWLLWIILSSILLMGFGGYHYLHIPHQVESSSAYNRNDHQTATVQQRKTDAEKPVQSSLSTSTMQPTQGGTTESVDSEINASSYKLNKSGAISGSQPTGMATSEGFKIQNHKHQNHFSNPSGNNPNQLLKHPKISRKKSRTASQNTTIVQAPTGEENAEPQPTFFSGTDSTKQVIVSDAVSQSARKPEPVHTEQGPADSGKKKELNLQPASAPVTAKSKRKASRFSLSIFSGADASGTHLLPAGGYSFRFGIIGAFSLTRHLAIQAGVFQNTKRYQCGPDAYQLPSYGYWNYMRIYQINASCKMTEIPIQLKFTIPGKNQQEWYGAAGISSYLISQEVYDYHYFRYNNPGVKTSTYTGNKHLFSQASFTVGYSYPISKRFSVLGECYQQIPLSGIGAGKVHLYAGGFQAGIRWNPSRKK